MSVMTMSPDSVGRCSPQPASIKHFARGIGMTGVMRGLFDEMEKYPSQIEPGPRWLRGVSEALDLDAWCAAHDRLRACCPCLIVGDDLLDRPIRRNLELELLRTRHLLPQVPPIDP